jgi:hypothetical protein
MRTVRMIGNALLDAWLVGLWWMSRWRSPLLMLVLALVGASVLIPAVQPWYFCWPLALAGLLALDRKALLAAAAVGVIFPAMLRPNGRGFDMKLPAPFIITGAILLTVAVLRAPRPPRPSSGSATDDDGAEHARTQVRADHRPQL